MSTKYPKPSTAASVWVEGDTMFLDFESHTVRIPLAKCQIECTSWGTPKVSQLGWNTLLTVLKDRSRASRKPTIGHKGAPVQYDVEQLVKAYTKSKREEIDAIETEDDLLNFMRKAGLI